MRYHGKEKKKKAFHVNCQEIMGSYSVTQRKLAHLVNSLIAQLPNASTETVLTAGFGSNFPARIDRKTVKLQREEATGR